MSIESIKNFTNIDSETFVGMYTGEEIPVKAGETKPFTETVAKHLADQLAVKILIREEKNYLTDPKKKVLLKEMLGDVTVPNIPATAVPTEKQDTAKEEETFADLPKEDPKEDLKKRGRPKK